MTSRRSGAIKACEASRLDKVGNCGATRELGALHWLQPKPWRPLAIELLSVA